jgi:outer membrane protein OmpA-like peptidoglycan-associated protein
MTYMNRARMGSIALASATLLLLANETSAQQPVRTFDDAPSIEQLRSIMVPESRPGAGRTIVIQRPTTNTGPSPVQPASTAPEMAQPSAPQRPQAPPQRPQAPPQEAEAGAVAFHINFAFNSAVLPGSAHTMIDRIAQLMKETPDLKLRVEGHTDATGTDSYNVSLSQERAQSVAQYLEAQGISADRLMLIGKGKSEPLMRDPFEPANRRVQFVRIS